MSGGEESRAAQLQSSAVAAKRRVERSRAEQSRAGAEQSRAEQEQSRRSVVSNTIEGGSVSLRQILHFVAVVSDGL